MDDHYATLGVSRTATSEEIRKAYRQLVLRHHPDKNGGKGTETFHKIQEAYEVLSDVRKKAEYDQKQQRPSASSSRERPGFSFARSRPFTNEFGPTFSAFPFLFDDGFFETAFMSDYDDLDDRPESLFFEFFGNPWVNKRARRGTSFFDSRNAARQAERQARQRREREEAEQRKAWARTRMREQQEREQREREQGKNEYRKQQQKREFLKQQEAKLRQLLEEEKQQREQQQREKQIKEQILREQQAKEQQAKELRRQQEKELMEKMEQQIKLQQERRLRELQEQQLREQQRLKELQEQQQQQQLREQQLQEQLQQQHLQEQLQQQLQQQQQQLQQQQLQEQLQQQQLQEQLEQQHLQEHHLQEQQQQEQLQEQLQEQEHHQPEMGQLNLNDKAPVKEAIDAYFSAQKAFTQPKRNPSVVDLSEDPLPRKTRTPPAEPRKEVIDISAEEEHAERLQELLDGIDNRSAELLSMLSAARDVASNVTDSRLLDRLAESHKRLGTLLSTAPTDAAPEQAK